MTNGTALAGKPASETVISLTRRFRRALDGLVMTCSTTSPETTSSIRPFFLASAAPIVSP